MAIRPLKINNDITPRDYITTLYFNDIKKLKCINQKEEIDLIFRFKQTQDEKLLDELVKANLRFVISVAKHYIGRGLDFSDLVNEGNIGLIKAARKFDETRGIKFITYAVWWIRQTIFNAISESGRMIRLPLNKVGMIHKYNNICAQLEQKLGRKPEDFEIVEEMQIHANDYFDIKSNLFKHKSLDEQFSFFSDGNDSNMTLHDYIECVDEENNPINNLMKNSLKYDIKRVLSDKGFKEIERKVLMMFYGLNTKNNIPLSIEEISKLITRVSNGREKHYSFERIRQIKEVAIKKMRYRKYSKVLRIHYY